MNEPCARSLRASSVLFLLVSSACTLEDVWTGKACGERIACGDAQVAKAMDAAGDFDASGTLCTCTSVPCSECTDQRAGAARPGCPSGRFSLDVTADYYASASGLCFVAAPNEALKADGTWSLTLVSTATGEHSADVLGCIRVPGQGEDAGAGDIDFRGSLSGTMNCDTGELSAEIHMTYFVVSVCTFGVFPTRYFAKGPATARYVKDTDRFENGAMEVREPPVLTGQAPGGTGTFVGARAAAVYDVDVAPDHCLGTTFQNSGFPDAGGADAGVLDAG